VNRKETESGVKEGCDGKKKKKTGKKDLSSRILEKIIFF